MIANLAGGLIYRSFFRLQFVPPGLSWRLLKRDKMNNLVKILSDDSGEPREKDSQFWHYVVNKTGSQTLCQGEYFGVGESGCDFVEKTTYRGGITCPECLKIINHFKSIKL